MNIYLDLEATEYTKEIISIGAVKENGQEFYTLIKPRKLRCVTERITNITGITKEMLDSPEIPYIDEAVDSFVKWCRRKNGENSDFHIFVFGDFDILLLENAKNHCGAKAKSELGFCLANTSDACPVLNRIVNEDPGHMMGIAKMFDTCFGTVTLQTHNALDDAKLLKEVHIKTKDTPLEVYKKRAEEENVRRYTKRYKNKELQCVPLKKYFEKLTPEQLAEVTIDDIGNYNGIYSKTEKTIKDWYYGLTGKHYTGNIYERK